MIQAFQLGRLLTNCLCRQSGSVPNGVNHSSRKYSKKLINFVEVISITISILNEIQTDLNSLAQVSDEQLHSSRFLVG